jgi:iron only hydrogenase large subunit-like protein
MNTKSPVYTIPTECQDCYRCIRRCPVKAIRVENNHAVVMSELCIACGRCVINCPAHAKRYRDDTPLVSKLLESGKKVIVSLAPSFRAEFAEYTPNQLISILKELGFYGVSETALGADLVSYEVASTLSRNISENNQKLFISSACPAAVEFIKRYMSDYASYITDCASPLLAHARYLRKVYGNDIEVVFIGPCIAKKREADVWSEISAALTFKELRGMLTEEGIVNVQADGHIDKNGAFVPWQGQKKLSEKPDFIPRRAAKAELFPLEGGMIAACKKYKPLKDVRTIAVSGIEAIRDTLIGLDVAALSEPLFLEFLSCTGGCVNGPGTEQTSAMALRRMQTIDFAEDADNTLDDNTISSIPEMKGTLPGDTVEKKTFTESQINDAMRSMGKYSTADEINCNGCGYETCRNFAVAMLNGVAEKTMCVSYMRKLAQKKANGLVRAIPSGVVIVDKNMTVVECNKNFARLIGQDIVDMYDVKPGLEGADLAAVTKSAQLFKSVLMPNGPDVVEREIHEAKKILHYTVFVIEKEEIAAGVVEDITAPKNQKDRTITQAQKVIDKNLATVQKIAFLLGENAAETESMLNSIIESYSLDDDNGDQKK